MGMFDDVFLDTGLVSELIEPKILERMSESVDKNYAYLQTKDLECCLNKYYFEKDGLVYCENISYENDEIVKRERKFCADLETYVDMYTYLRDVDGEDIFIELKAHVIAGKIEKISVSGLTRDNTADREEALRLARERREKIIEDPLYRLYFTISRTRWWLRRNLFYPMSKTLDSLERYLKDKAESKYDDDRTE